MMYEQSTVHMLYKKLLALYPREFREWLGESMEQTFNDLCNEKRQARKGLLGFVVWAFVETAIGIFRERLLLITKGDIKRLIFANLGSSAFISFLIVLPFMIMELVNRQSFFVSGKESFPIGLFVMLWILSMLFILILMPIVRNLRRAGHNIMADAVPTQGNTLLTNPKSAAIISIALILSFAIVALLDYLCWAPMDYLINGPNPEQPYVPGLFIALALFSIPVAAGFIARGPIVNSLRAGGSLFAHPINLIIVIVILASLAWSWGSWAIDQWPCFLGVPNCD
jgi:hypothetical protein